MNKSRSRCHDMTESKFSDIKKYINDIIILKNIMGTLKTVFMRVGAWYNIFSVVYNFFVLLKMLK